MLEFKSLSEMDRQAYQKMLEEDRPRGCEYTYNNLYLWGNQKVAFTCGCAVIASEYDGFQIYPYPVGPGDRRAAVEAIMEDARERGIPLRISGMNQEDTEELAELFPGKFLFRPYRNGYDYVYEIQALAELKGKKLQKKRNHINRFLENNPQWQVENLTEELLPEVQEMLVRWFALREQELDSDFQMEKTALRRAFDHYGELGMEGLVLRSGGELLAFTMGSRMNANTFDTHFEKAMEVADGAYPMITREFARYLRERYPEIRFVNREDDMGMEGLRQAKLSYNPHHLIEKNTACLAEEGWGEDG